MDVSERLRPFVAGLVIDWLRATPDARHRMVSGTLVFADISGFTRLTERLAAKGKIGAEEMSDILDVTFAALLSVAYDHGAWLVKWGGDAVLLLFEGPDDAERACTAAHEMRRTLREVGRLRTSVGEVQLRMSVGVHTGEFDFYLVGSLHRELVITGPGASQAVEMETAADGGEIIISPQTAARLATRCVGLPKGAGLLLARSPAVTPPSPQRSDRDLTGVDLSSCLPQITCGHLLAGGSDGEHRLVTVGFIEFSGVQRLGAHDAVAAAVDHLVRRCQEAAARHEVAFWETDVSVDGGKVMLVSGAPRSAGQDEDRMLAVVRDVVDSAAELSLRAGINGGRVYAGEFGPPFRRTFSVKGDAVNLAARLMAAAGAGEVYASHAVVTRARTRYSTQLLAPLAVKGKKRPVLADRVGEPLGAAAATSRIDLSFSGREDELSTLLQALAGARAGTGQTWEISGEAGIGKSRLVAELVANTDATTVATMACDQYHSATPYAPFRRTLRKLAGIAEDASADAAGLALLEVVSRAAPSQLPWTPLIAAVLDATVPPTAESRALEPKFRKAVQEQRTAQLLAALVPGPLLLTVEDAHLMDDASLDLLRHLATEAAEHPWLIVATRLQRSEHIFDAQQLELGPLGPDAVDAVIKLATEDHPLPPHEIALLSRRAGGNPLFVHELLGAARTGSPLSALPDSVEGVMAVQIDRLEPRDRHILRIASVLGVRVDPRVLHEVLDLDGIDVGSAQAVFDEFLDHEGDGLRFRHALARDTAYEGLPFRRRQALHRTAGHVIERLAGEHPETVAGLLSLHFLHGHEYAAAWQYARVAGERARDVHAQAEAAEFFERALVAAKGTAADDHDELAEVAEALADARYKLGEFDRAASAYRQAKTLATDGVPAARLCYKLSLVADRVGQLRVALGWLTKARQLLTAKSDDDTLRMRAECASQYGLIRHWQGRDVDAVAALHEAVVLAEQARADDAVATALVWLDNCEMTLGVSSSGEHAQRALEIWRGRGDRPWEEARVLNQLGIRAYFEGRWDLAVDYYDQSKQACDRAGDQFTAAVESGNMAEVLSDQGHLDEAERLLREAQRVWRAAGAPSFIAFGKSQLGRLAARSSRFDEALQLLNSARDDYVDDGEHGEVLESDTRIAECLLLRGDFDAALTAADAALSVATASAAVLPQVPALQRIRGLALAGAGDHEHALQSLDESLASARDRRARHEIAWTLHALTQTRITAGQGALDDDLRAEQEALFDQLGIVAVASTGPRLAATETANVSTG
ncbi:MAG: AAA family ATPase [Acidothermaceae bacterium]